MLDPMKLGVFFGAALILAVTPGPAVAYIVTRSVSQGRLAGLVSTLGIALGAAARSWLTRQRGYARSERYVTGSVYVGLGLATALSGGGRK